MRAVAAGYLEYKDCSLNGKELETLESWAVSRVRRSEATYLREMHLDITKSMLHLGGDLKDRIERIQELRDEITSDILGVEYRAANKSDDERYKEVFGEVTGEDIEDLEQHLEDRSLVIEQESMSKDEALRRLEDELGSRFRNRIT